MIIESDFEKVEILLFKPSSFYIQLVRNHSVKLLEIRFLEGVFADFVDFHRFELQNLDIVLNAHNLVCFNPYLSQKQRDFLPVFWKLAGEIVYALVTFGNLHFLKETTIQMRMLRI